MQTSITVHGYTIVDPLTYWSQGSISPDEASCLDMALPVGQPYSPDTPLLPYWPCYSQISPDQRARYLSWLSGGKNRDLDEIGYVFLYFYGLERRALIDGKDYDLIVPEVHRLLNRYRNSSSFDSYLGGFLAYLAAQRLETLTEDNLRAYFPEMAKLNDLGTMVALAWFAQNKMSLPWDLAYSVARNFSGISVPSVVKKEISYLEDLFHTRYNLLFEGGLSVVPAKNPYRLEYRPASPSLLSSFFSNRAGSTIAPCPIPNPLGRKKQFSGLFSLWETSLRDVQPFLNQLAKTEGSITWQAYSRLPEELRMAIPHPDQKAWDRLFSEHNEGVDWAFVPASSLAQVIKLEKRDCLTPAQSRDLSQTVYDSGYLLLPDLHHAGNSYRWDDNLVLIPLSLGKGEALSPSFPSYALMLELGIGIAAADGLITPEELAHLRTFFKDNFTLAPFECLCLEALECLYTQNPPSLTRLGRRLKEGLDPDTRLTVAQFLVGMAAVDGILDPKEEKNLKRVFKAMDIEEEYVQCLLTRAEAIVLADSPFVVRRGTAVAGGETLPPPAAAATSTAFVVDERAVARILSETREVSEILGEVFAKEETNTGDFVLDVESAIDKSGPQEVIPLDHDTGRLQPRYVPVLEELLTTDLWTKEEFVHLVQCHHCMPQATIEAINTWAETEFGDFLLEDDHDSVRVHRDLVVP